MRSLIKSSFYRVSPFLLAGLFILNADAQNLLTDPDFESGGAAWQMSTSGGRSVVNTGAENGTFCEQMVLAAQGFPRAVWQTVTVTGNTSYDVSGWVKTDLLTTGAHIMVLWFNTATPPDNQVPAGFIKIDTLATLTGTNAWTSQSGTYTAPAAALTAQVYLECVSLPGTGTAWFDNLSFAAHPAVVPHLISAIASDNLIRQAGIDNDDYVLLTFDTAVAIFTVTPQNINTIFPISNGHNWLSGFGSFGGAMWNPDSTKLLITLSIIVSAPTISVGDSISFITGSLGDQGKVVLTGSFDPSGVIQKGHNPFSANLFRITKTSSSIHFTYPEQVHLKIFGVKGNIIADLGSGTNFIWNYKGTAHRAAAGIYYAQFYYDDRMVTCKKVVIP